MPGYVSLDDSTVDPPVPIGVAANPLVVMNVSGGGVAAATNWSYAPPVGGITNSTAAVTVKAAAGAGIRNYITAIQISNDALTNATEVAVRDGTGGTVIWRAKVSTAGPGVSNIYFPNPLRGTANTLLEIVTLTASGAGSVYVDLQGFTAA